MLRARRPNLSPMFAQKGPVLISWQHELIPEIVNRIVGKMTQAARKPGPTIRFGLCGISNRPTQTTPSERAKPCFPLLNAFPSGPNWASPTARARAALYQTAVCLTTYGRPRDL